jgi:hypothetical protein
MDLSSLPEYPTSQAVINHIPIRWEQFHIQLNSEIRSDQYYLPRYSEISNNYPIGDNEISFINCPLEFEIIHPEFLKILLILLIFFVIIFLLTYNNNRRIIWF